MDLGEFENTVSRWESQIKPTELHQSHDVGMDLGVCLGDSCVGHHNVAADAVMDFGFETPKNIKKPKAIEPNSNCSDEIPMSAAKTQQASKSQQASKPRKRKFLQPPSLLQPADLAMFLAFLAAVLAIPCEKFFLELCAGAGGFCLALNELGWQSVGVDNECSSRFVCLLDITAQ